MIWHSSLLQDIIQKQKHPAMATAIRLSDINEREWQEERRRLKYHTKQRLKNGARLVEQRDTGKRKWDDMFFTEKMLIEDYETGKCGKEYEATHVKKPRA